MEDEFRFYQHSQQLPECLPIVQKNNAPEGWARGGNEIRATTGSLEAMLGEPAVFNYPGHFWEEDQNHFDTPRPHVASNRLFRETQSI